MIIITTFNIVVHVEVWEPEGLHLVYTVLASTLIQFLLPGIITALLYNRVLAAINNTNRWDKSKKGGKSIFKEKMHCANAFSPASRLGRAVSKQIGFQLIFKISPLSQKMCPQIPTNKAFLPR